MPEMTMPPRTLTAEGCQRRIGVEVEFSNVNCRTAAELVQRRFGGDVGKIDPHRFVVEKSALGTFTVELDSQYAHRHGAATRRSESSRDPDVSSLIAEEIHAAIGDVGSLWLPVEIVGPPIPLERLPELDRLVDDLRGAGAEGTDGGLLYAFATQLNPEVPSRDHRDIANHLKAFLLLSGTLRAEIGLDVNRRLLPFTDPFPDHYVRKVVAPDYQPDRDTLIDDYLSANATRNRELDLLPLFAELDAGRVRARVDDGRIKARPTFHYRLPDSRMSDPDWCLVTEWNRWVRVEVLADDAEGLRSAGEAYLSRRAPWVLREWADRLANLFW